MNLTSLSHFAAGAGCAAFAASAVFFARFWYASRDRFYLYFSFACALLALERLVLDGIDGAQTSVPTPLSESYAWVYLIRLAAFSALVVAVLNKSRQRSQ